MAASERIDLDVLTNEQLDDMLREFRLKADSMHELFSSLDSRISSILDDPAGSPLCTTSRRPASIDDEVQAYKLRELERLDLGYIIPILNEQEVKA